MNRTILLAYQSIIALSDTFTGALLVVAPALTLSLMRLHAPADTLVFISFIGAFVFAVGLSCLYGAILIFRGGCRHQLEIVWLLTAFMRASVAIFVLSQVLTGSLEAGWLTVAASDAACVVFQGVGLYKGWLAHAAR
jgi:hypothetical protein